MKSEANNNRNIQVRMGAVTHESYFFFSRELGDLILEPGDEIILVAVKKIHWLGQKSKVETEGRKGIFLKIRKHLITQEATHKLANRTFDAFGCLKDAIYEYYLKRKRK